MRKTPKGPHRGVRGHQSEQRGHRTCRWIRRSTSEASVPTVYHPKISHMGYTAVSGKTEGEARDGIEVPSAG